MSDIVTRLLLKTNDFDANLEKSKKGVNDFQGGISNMAQTAGKGIVKFAGTIGVAMGAYEGLMKVINSSQTTGDAYVKMMDQAKASVDSFFSSIALGNFDGFLSNLQNVIDKAGDLSTALDNLGTKTLFNKAEVDDLNTKYQIELNKAKARNISDEERNKHLAKAKEYLIQMASLQQSLATANSNTSYTAMQAEIAKMGFNKNVSREMWDYLIKDSNRANIEKTSATHKDKIFEFNKRIESSKIRDPYTEQVVDSDETKKIREELKKYKESRFGLYGELNRLFLEAADDEKSAISQALKMRTTANSLKVAVSNKELEVANVDAKINGSYNKRNGGGNGGGKQLQEKPKEGSLAWYNEEISKQNKNLIAETDMQARAAIQATINELETKKINLKFVVDQEAFKIAHGEMKDFKLELPKASHQTLSIGEVYDPMILSYNEMIAEREKRLAESNDETTSIFIQSQINKLKETLEELKKLQKLQETWNSEIIPLGAYDALMHTDTKDKNGNETNIKKKLKDMKLPEHKPLFDKKDVKLNQDYAESLSSIGSIMRNMSGLFDDNTASALRWGTTLLSTIMQAVPAIIGMMTVKKTDTTVTNENTTAEVANATSKVMSAHAGIPFAGIALGLAGVAAIIAAMSSIPKFATGGIVPGASFTGDKVPALLNSGEMILNGSQQSNLFNMLNSGIYGSLSQRITPTLEDQTIRLYSDVEIRGDRLFLVLNNHIKKTGKKWQTTV